MSVVLSPPLISFFPSATVIENECGGLDAEIFSMPVGTVSEKDIESLNALTDTVGEPPRRRVALQTSDFVSLLVFDNECATVTVYDKE